VPPARRRDPYRSQAKEIEVPDLFANQILALCLGGEIHALLVRHGWARQDEAYAACSVTSRCMP
jgi:hypothetical protein